MAYFHLFFLVSSQISEAPATEAPDGRPTKKAEMLKSGSPGAIYVGDDSYGAAAAKIASIVVSAGAVTWFGIPLLVYLIRLVFPESGVEQ